MGTMATVRVNTTQRMVLYRDFIIEQTQADEWEWTHENYDRETYPVTGTCQTLYECIDAVENWHDNQAEDAWQRQQEALMESGGSDDSAYRRDIINAGRGHLLRGS